MAPPADTASTLGLIKQAAGGNAPAFGELYKMYLDRIYRYLFYQVRDRMTAEDMTEEVFLKTWRALPRFHGDERAFTSWLYRIAHNHFVDSCRARRPELPLDENLLAADCPEVAADGLLAGGDLDRLLSGLPAQQRQIIILKFIEGLENEEIAAVTGKSQGAVRITQMRALANLKRKIVEVKAND
jgi:RNA polymerase sigma-70 factor (ECF subfamily)